MNDLPKTKQELDQAIKQGIETYLRNKQFSYSKIASHEHNGTDTIKISQVNILNGIKKTSFLVDTNTTGSPLVVIDTLPNIANLNRITFMGFAANNATGSATKRALINGLAEIGPCYFTDSTQIVPAGKNIISSSNAMYVDGTTLANNRVSATNGYFCYFTDETGAVIVQTLVTYGNKTITFTTTLAAGWKLQGSLIIS